MRDLLFLQLSDAADGLCTYALTGATPSLGVQATRAPLESIAPLAAGRQLVLLVPGTEVRLATVKVPARQPQKVLQAAPYALEDQMAEDVETLQFAIGPRQEDGSHPVAIVARARLDAWLARLQAHHLRPAAVVSETLCLPRNGPGHWIGVVDAARVTVRTATWSGFACPLDDLPMALELADPESRVPLKMHLAHDVAYDFSKLSHPVELLPGGSALETLVRGYRPDTAINLLQGSYSGREDWQRAWQPWRAAAVLAGLWLALALLVELIQGIRTGQELRAQETRNLARFQATFPGQKPLADLALQLDSLQAASRNTQRAPLLPLLQLLAEALAANPGLTVQSLQFREGALFLNLNGKDYQAVEALRAWFASRKDGLLEIQSENAGADGVQTRVRLALA
ncbi:MAG TPA: type II secretion system protein GspL [Candidatus Binatia bacterium]|nr:type II secretion system protein GspL [Candidatus Binatia bacterium]